MKSSKDFARSFPFGAVLSKVLRHTRNRSIDKSERKLDTDESAVTLRAATQATMMKDLMSDKSDGFCGVIVDSFLSQCTSCLVQLSPACTTHQEHSLRVWTCLSVCLCTTS